MDGWMVLTIRINCPSARPSTVVLCGDGDGDGEDD